MDRSDWNCIIHHIMITCIISFHSHHYLPPYRADINFTPTAVVSETDNGAENTQLSV